MNTNNELDTNEVVEDEEIISDEEQIAGNVFFEIGEKFRNGEELLDEELDRIADLAINTVRGVLAYFDVNDATISEYEGEEGELILDVTDADLAVLIGRHGRTLDALQTIISLMINRQLGFRYPIVVDIESYKSRRRQKVETIAVSAADRAADQNREVKLKPMSAYERRVVHMALRDRADVETSSEGRDPMRYVVIRPL